MLGIICLQCPQRRRKQAWKACQWRRTAVKDHHRPRTETPTYWQLHLAKKARAKNGFALISLDRSRDASLWKMLQKLLATDHNKLSKGRDVRQPGDYDRLKVACAWRLEHPKLWDGYVSGRGLVQQQVSLLRKQRISAPSLELKTDDVAKLLPGRLNAEANERVLLHGTKPGVLLDILSNGPNEHFSSGIFGHGTYLADDVGKNDQYVTVDPAHDTAGDLKELHARLFAKVKHPRKLYYLLVCRVALGHCVKTQDGIRSIDGKTSIFAANDKRELAAVPEASAGAATVRFHSLVAEPGRTILRFSEFVVFRGSCIYPEYLVAYQRILGANGHAV